MNVTPLGIINAAFGKRSHQFTINQDTIKSVGSDYDDTVGDIYDAKRKANKSMVYLVHMLGIKLTDLLMLLILDRIL